MEEDRVEGSIEHSEEFVNEFTPCVGMEFESEDAAYRFYCEYGRILGFCVRKDYISKSKRDGVMINRKFVCSKEGVKGVDKRTQTTSLGRLETRTNCKAFLYISLDRASLKWTVKRFDETHNHLLHIPETVHMMRNQRGLTESQGITVEIAEATGLPLKLSHDLIRALLRYFQKQTIDNPYFFHGMQLDVDEMITNIFWADHEMIRDYELFGDTLSFDTTFRTNKEFRPLAIFTGFNHFRMTVIFGVALMYDETIPSFVWLFEKFLEAMSGKKPFTFFTDQDQAMANAISQVMPDVKHGLCTFHINQNAMKHLGYLYGKESTFASDFNACMFLYEDEKELEEAWDSLLKSYNLKDNEWMNKTWELRRKWAHVYMKLSYNAGMRSTQLSESLNAKLKKHLKSNLRLDQFLTQLDKVVFDKRYNEKEAAHGSREEMVRLKYPSCPMLLHVSKLYTPPIFDLFHKELDISLGCKVIQLKLVGDEIRCVIQKHGQEREYVVLASVELDALGAKTFGGVRCSCRKFESFGILCGHAIKGKEVMVEETDRKFVISARYRHLCPKMVTLAARSSEDDEAYRLVEDTITSLGVQVENIFLSKHSHDASSSGADIDMGIDSINPILKNVKGLKKKFTDRARKGGRRLKPWYEKLKKRAKGVPQPQFSQGVEQSGSKDDGTPYYPQTAHLLTQASSSSQISEDMEFGQAGHITIDGSIQIAMETESFFHNEGFIDFIINPQPPSHY
ncbi:hypothetical protein RHSIM_Rhsim12G0053100 [Rhododendron simsii]|uniref:Protein FAR1-RELATED SEQUENCE n=1 Tax=Rhododendron simsii TaxID=118357 RepID=A0A834G4J0_RHOSS|nr:hypothetical protein RHSIM_Rhsim12G0053100 [Rhododendron simsii]